MDSKSRVKTVDQFPGLKDTTALWSELRNDWRLENANEESGYRRDLVKCILSLSLRLLVIFPPLFVYTDK